MKSEMDRSVDELIARGFSREQAIKIYLENNTHRGHYPPQQTGLSAQHAMVVPPQSYGSSQNSSFPIPENADDQALQLGLLLSQQEAMFGSNMYDSLTAADDPIIENFMSKGYSKEEAILYVFEGKFGKALAQPVATTQPVPHRRASSDASTHSAHSSVSGGQKTHKLLNRPTSDQSFSLESIHDISAKDELEIELLMTRGYTRDHATQIHFSHGTTESTGKRRTSSGTSHSPVHSIPPYDNGQQNGDFAREEELASMMARGLSRDQALKLYQQKQVSSGGSVSGRSAHSHTSRLSAMNNDYPSPKSHVRARSEIPTGFLKSSDDQGDAMLSPTRKTHSIGGFFGSQGGSAESHSGKKASLSDFFDDLDNVSVSSRVRKGNHEDFDDGPQLQHSRNRSVSGGITPVTDSRIGIGGRKPVSKEFYSELDHASATALQRNNSRSSLDKANRRFSKSSFDGNEDDSSPLYQEPEYNDSNEKNPPGYKSSPLSEREKMQRRANFSEHESKIIELTERLTREETRRKMAEEDCDELKKKMKELERSYEESEKKVKIRLESQLDETISSYKKEISILKDSLDSQQKNVNAFTGEKQDFEKTKSNFQDELSAMQAKLREAETNSVKSRRDMQHLNNEITELREELSKKDRLLRDRDSTVLEEERKGIEERSTLKAELNFLQNRNAVLEQERLTTTAELVTKREEVSFSTREIHRLQDALKELENKVATRDTDPVTSKDSLIQLEIERELRSKSEAREESERRERIAATAQLMAIQSELASKVGDVEERKNMQIESLKAEVLLMRQQRDAAIDESRRKDDKINMIEEEVKHLQRALEEAPKQGAVDVHEYVEKIAHLSGEIEGHKRSVLDLQRQLEMRKNFEAELAADYEEKFKQSDLARRKLHNLVQELRGNVRVYARVRPFLPNDGVDFSKPIKATITVRSDEQTMKIVKPGQTEGSGRPDEFTFTFDKAFGPSASQENVFMEVSELVQSALDGYHVCLFSYGQTGSGKTHTMQGSGNGSMRGIIPRAMQQVGMYKNELEAKGWEYSMTVTYVEIYNETIRDLLRKGGDEECKHEVKKDAQGISYITDVTVIEVDPNNAEQVEGIMELAARQRSTAQTAMNEQSSRSHSIFALQLRATNISQEINLEGTLSLVDLAGSERLDRSKVTGAQLKETVSINKSLSALTDVFVAIANKQSHIPFRNSILTYLLQPALSGDGKTLMMVNLSPTEESYFESLCSLRLAKTINQCELGKPKKQVKSSDKSKK